MVSRDKQKQFGIKRLFLSFRYALDGIHYAFRYEQNMVVHFIVMLFVIFLGIFFRITLIEWLVCILLIGFVIATELINTAIEAVVDLSCPKVDPLAKIAKDTAAGAVLVFAFTSLLGGLIIFLPKIIAWLSI